MVQEVSISTVHGLEDYAGMAHLRSDVDALRDEAGLARPRLAGRRIWMVNSTAQGGGVAEMLPKMVSMLRELGFDAHWLVIETDREQFFTLTKRIHNMIHGVDLPELGAEERALYDQVSRENADAIEPLLKPDDLLVIHDPQPLGTGSVLKERTGVTTIWRCHIGLDEHLPVTNRVWRFLRGYLTDYDRAVFSAPEYIPGFLTGLATVLHPALDPLSPKNEELSIHKVMGVLCNGGLSDNKRPVLTPRFEHTAKRLTVDGRWLAADEVDDLGLPYRPTVLQLSRWDRLKGYRPLMDAFVEVKRRLADASGLTDTHRRRLSLARLVLAGPDPEGVSDDPEGQEVLDDLCQRYLALGSDLQRDIALIALPMQSRRHNALLVNVLQRCATIAVQNSVREGFGLTATEAMWKGTVVVGSNACGLRQQIRDQLDGVLHGAADDVTSLAASLDDLLADPDERLRLGRNARRRVHDEFLIFSQLRGWIRALSQTIES